MRYVVYALVLLLALVLQTAGVPGVVFLGCKPELVLLLTLLAAMILPPAEAVVFGFFAGLAQDLIVGRFITLHAGVFVVVILAERFVTQRFYRENLVVRFLTLVLGTALAEVLYLLGAASFGLSRPWTGQLLGTLAVVSVLNGFVGALMYKPLTRLQARLIHFDERVKRTG